ncbi:histidine--tRNA ligase [Patescibacteria group bacterium]|nr:histidine--tRNA ligase [Patescibacteria group bacterium]
MIKAQTLKGFRDFLPEETRKRQFVINTLKEVFELYGFEPLETPALEYQEVLTGKYGDEGEKLMYKFEDNGKRKVALRYDQTVPLARVAAQYQNELTFPFKRYQIQNVWRAENPQKGRFREFLQLDVDTIGSSSSLSDAEIIALAIRSLEILGFKDFKVYINNREAVANYFKTKFNIPTEKQALVFRAIDKVMKIGKAGVIDELTGNGFDKKQAEEIFDGLKTLSIPDDTQEVFDYLQKMGISQEKYKFDPFLTRGLDYYTGLVFEVDIEGYSAGSIAGGGRYDNLIGIFAEKSIPAVGFAFGFDRLIEAMEQFDLFPKDLEVTKVLVAISDLNDSDKEALKTASELRENFISTEIYLGQTSEKNLLEKQLKYADKKQIPYVLIINGKELILKDMDKRTQETLSMEKIIEKLTVCTCGNC